MMQLDSEYRSSVTLVITAETLDAAAVNAILDLQPDKAWRKGERKKVGDSVYQTSGWKRFLPTNLQAECFEDQLAYWAGLLSERIGGLEKLAEEGHCCVLDCLIITDATASIVLPPALQHAVTRLRLELHLSVWMSQPPRVNSK